MMDQRNQSGWVVERPDIGEGRSDLITVFPPPNFGIVHLSRISAFPYTPPELWKEEDRLRSSVFRGPFYGVSGIASNYGNLEIVAAQKNGALGHFWRHERFGWYGPTLITTRAAGMPAMIQSRFGQRGNFEVVVPTVNGGLSHFWRDNDGSCVWHEAVQNRPAAIGIWEGVGLIHSKSGNLAAVGIQDGNLMFLCQNGVGGNWTAPQPIAERCVGRPSIVETVRDNHHTFDVVAARQDGCLRYFSWDTQAQPPQNAPGEEFGQIDEIEPPKFDDVAVLRNTFGFEVFARRVLNEPSVLVLRHYRRALPASWAFAGTLPLLGPDK